MSFLMKRQSELEKWDNWFWIKKILHGQFVLNQLTEKNRNEERYKEHEM